MKENETKQEVTVIWLDEKPITAEACLNALRRNGQIKFLIRELLIEEALETITLNKERATELVEEFKRRKGLSDRNKYEEFLKQNLISEELHIEHILRPSMLAELREERWGPRANSLYLKHKERYDLVKYRLLRSKDENMMQEAYFRLKEGEQSWENLYQELKTGGVEEPLTVGPVQVSKIDPVLLKLLRDTGIGRLTKPTRLKDQIIIGELIENKSSVLDDSIREKLLSDECRNWLDQECSKALEKLRYVN